MNEQEEGDALCPKEEKDNEKDPQDNAILKEHRKGKDSIVVVHHPTWGNCYKGRGRFWYVSGKGAVCSFSELGRELESILRKEPHPPIKGGDRVETHMPHASHGHGEGERGQKERLLAELVQRTRAFRENPEQWWNAHRQDLLLQGPATYAVECVDEGDDLEVFLPTQGHRLSKNFDVISVPGSGVKYPGFAADLRRCVGTQYIMGITSHKDCGACEGKDDLAITHAKSLAQELSVPYLGHVETLQRPSYHVALGSNLRYTRKVKNLRFAKDAPRYFDASQWGLSSKEARITNIKLMLNIAYHHGFNKLFVEQDIPFELVVWYDPSDPLHTKESAADEIQEAFRQADLPQELHTTKGLLRLTFMEVT